MASIIIRTAIVYILLTISLRITGKRQLGELDVGELVCTLLISELMAIPIDDPDIPLLNAVIPTLFVISLEIIISAIKNKSEKLKRAVEGTPTYIIYKGRLLQDVLKENRISINELLSEMRKQSITDIQDVEYGILEQGGSLSIVKTSDTPLAHAIIIDGEVISESLKSIGLDERWLQKQLDKERVRLPEVFLMTVNDNLETNVIKRDTKE